jgi:hypothetical protein
MVSHPVVSTDKEGLAPLIPNVNREINSNSKNFFNIITKKTK